MQSSAGHLVFLGSKELFLILCKHVLTEKNAESRQYPVYLGDDATHEVWMKNEWVC